MNDIDHEYKQAKKSFSKLEEKALKIIIKKENQIEKTQSEIAKIMQENNLNILDIDKYKHDKNFEEFQNIKFPK